MTKKYSSDLWNYLLKNDDFNKFNLKDRFEMIKMILEGCSGDSVHLDIKPNNIFLDEDENGKWKGEMVLADYGIGGYRSADHGCGTAGFASPQQMVTQVYQSSDIYSIGKGLFKITSRRTRV